MSAPARPGIKGGVIEAANALVKDVLHIAETEPPVSRGGKKFVIDKVEDLNVLIKRVATRRALKQLNMEHEEQFVAALRETERRLASQVATVDQMVGTFLEVVGAQHDIVVGIRDGLIDVNLEALVYAHLRGESCFIAAGTSFEKALALPFEQAAGRGAMPTRGGGRFGPSLKQNLLEKLSGEELDAIARERLGWIDRRQIVPMRDVMIDGLEFADRATMLRLANGKWLLLLSEEYKTIGSGGINPQVSIRDNRLFNELVHPDSEFSFNYPGSGKPDTIRLGDVLISAATSSSDKLGIKAGNRERYEMRFLKGTKGVIERKAQWGEVVEVDQSTREMFLFVGLQYPSNSIRAMFETIWAGAPAP